MLNPNSPQRSAASASNCGGAGPASVPAQPLVLQLPAPHPLQERMNRREWKTWRQQWEDYAQVSRIGEQSKKYQAAVLRGCIGPTGLEVYSGLPFVGAGDRDDTVKILELLEGYYIGKTNVIYERYKFHSRNQKDGESTTTYIGELRRLAHSCDFENITPDQLIRDRIVCGVRDDGLRKKLLQSDNLSLDGCVSTCRASELAGAQASSMTEELRSTRSEVESDIKYVANRKRWVDRRPQKSAEPGWSRCEFCGGHHRRGPGQCPAYGQRCRYCKRMNHFESQCRLRNNWQSFKQERPVQIVSTEDYAEAEQTNMMQIEENESVTADILMVRTRRGGGSEESTRSSGYPNKLFKSLVVQGKLVRFQVDTGATCDILRLEDVTDKAMINPTTQRLCLYDGTLVTPVGQICTRTENPNTGQMYDCDFIVVNDASTSLIGARTSLAMGLIRVDYESIAKTDIMAEPAKCSLTKEAILERYSDVFAERVGCLEGKLHLERDQSVTPVQMPVRKVPLAMQELLQAELRDMEDRGIIASVDVPTDWVSSMVVEQKKNGKLRVCLDPRPLNKALKRAHYPMPVIDDLLPSLAKARVFSVCDLRSGFWHISLDEESSFLTTFATPFGRYRWLRMPFGIAPAPEIFQNRLEAALSGLVGVKAIVDDLLVFGEGETVEKAIEEHNARLLELLERCRDKGIQLQPEKFRFQAQEVKYCGHVFTQEGLKPDPDKISAIVSMTRPIDKQEMRRYLGMVNYLARFLPCLSDMAEPLRGLMKEGVMFILDGRAEAAFQCIQKALVATPVLRFFNPSLDTVLQCDASSTGLGVALLQEGQPVAFASRVLTQSEQNYAQIEKELLAIVFGLTRFRQYVYGRAVIIDSDHKPLQALYSKPLALVPKRLQRMFLYLQDFDYQIRYRRGVDMHLADTLSRAPIGASTQRSKEELELAECLLLVEENSVIRESAIPEFSFEEVVRETETDAALQLLVKTVQEGWPESSRTLPIEVSPYFPFREEIVWMKGVLWKGNRCVIPKNMRQKILKRLHAAHSGVESCLKLAREYVFWPGITAQVKEHVRRCQTCAMTGPSLPKETWAAEDAPTRPWQIVGVDLFEFETRQYLIVTDYFSSFWEIDNMTSTTSVAVIRKMKSIFARHGVPDKLRSDNGPQFISEQFRSFATEWGFRHCTASPRYPQSNGKAENSVKTAKAIMQKARQTGEDVWLAVLTWRNTATTGFSTSPVQRLFGRRTNIGTLPVRRDLLSPEIPQNAVEEFKRTKEQQKTRYNKNAHDLVPLSSNEQVWVQTVPGRSHWKKGKIIRQTRDREYLVEVDGQRLRRNRRYVKKDMSFGYDDDSVSQEEEKTVEQQGEHGFEEHERERADGQESGLEVEHPEVTVRQQPKVTGMPESGYRTASGRTVRNPVRFGH